MGWEDLGNMIGGGIDREGQFEAGRFRSAQTEDALQQARVNQAKAIQTEQQNAQVAALKAKLAAGGVDLMNPDQAALGDILLGGLAGDASQLGDYGLKTQKHGLVDKMADPTQSALVRTRAGQALEGKSSSDLVAIGSKDFTNLTQDVPTVAPLPGAAAASDGGSVFNSPAGKLAEDRRKIAQMFGEKSPQMREFDEAAMKLTLAGGVPTFTQPFSSYDAPQAPPTAPPQGTAPPIFAPPSKPAVAPDTVASNTALTTDAKETTKIQSKLRNALPGVTDTIETFKKSVDDFTKTPGFESVYGKSGIAWRMSPDLFQSKDFRNADALLKNLNAQGFTVAVQKLRGLGALSNAEGAKVEAALAAALDAKQDESQAAALWTDFQGKLDNLLAVAEQEAGVAPSSAARSFATEAEAVAAGVKPGDRVIIGGVSGVWE